MLLFAMQLDLTTADGLQHCFDILGPVDVIINCAAVSSPAACEKDVGNARLAAQHAAYTLCCCGSSCTTVNRTACLHILGLHRCLMVGMLQKLECPRQAIGRAGSAQSRAQ